MGETYIWANFFAIIGLFQPTGMCSFVIYETKLVVMRLSKSIITELSRHVVESTPSALFRYEAAADLIIVYEHSIRANSFFFI